MGTENKARRSYNFYVACVAVQDFKIASCRHFAKLVGPLDSAKQAHEWHQEVLDRIEEIGQHPVNISVIGRTARTKGLLNDHFGYNAPD